MVEAKQRGGEMAENNLAVVDVMGGVVIPHPYCTRQRAWLPRPRNTKWSEEIPAGTHNPPAATTAYLNDVIGGTYWSSASSICSNTCLHRLVRTL